MQIIKQCPLCGKIYHNDVQYCRLNHCVFCGSTDIDDKKKNLRTFGILLCLSSLLTSGVLAEAYYSGKFVNEFDMVVKIFIIVIFYGVFALWMFHYIGVGKYSCNKCNKKFSEPISGKIRLIDLAKPNTIQGLTIPINFGLRIKEIGNLPWELYESKKYNEARSLFGELATLYKNTGNLEKACESFYFAGKCSFLSGDYEFAERDYCRAINWGFKIRSKYVKKALNELEELYNLIGRKELIKKVEEFKNCIEVNYVKNCPKCGERLPWNAKYCGVCGHELLVR